MGGEKILVTGGAGYIGSHTVLQLLLEGHTAVVLDNLHNSSPLSITRLNQLAPHFQHNLTFLHKIPLVLAGRRAGDIETVYASTVKAERELNWKAKYGIQEMCRDQWNWASKNPYGYKSQNSTSSS